MIRVAQIQAIVARECGIPVRSMTRPHGIGSREHAKERQLAIALATRLTDHSLVRIGHFFGGRDHTTVIHAVKAVEERSRTDPAIKETMRRITLELCR